MKDNAFVNEFRGPGGDGNPEKLVEDAEDRPRAAPLQHGELLPEHEVLEDKIPATTEEAEERSEAEQKQIEHGSES